MKLTTEEAARRYRDRMFAAAFSACRDRSDADDAVQDALDWTPERRPRLFVSEDCPNTIYALENWRGVDGEKGATKDPVDCVRYFYTSGCTEDTQHLAASPRRESRWRRSQDLGAPRRVRVRFR